MMIDSGHGIDSGFGRLMTGLLALVRRFGAGWRGILAVGVMSLALAGCASQSDKDDVTLDATPPEQMYNEGLALMNEGKFTRALKRFEDLDRTHPYSDWSRKAILMQAYSSHQVGAYTDSISAAKRYITLYPANEDAPYAMFLIGEGYFKQMPDVSRDQDLTKRAQAAYQEILQRYPQSSYAGEARKRIEITRDQIAGQEMFVGRYYLDKRQYLASINRFKTVVSEYQTTRHVEEALARLVECYFALGVATEAQTAAAVLGHNFPESQWYKDSYKLLASGGLEPRESGDSWISKAFKGFKVF